MLRDAVVDFSIHTSNIRVWIYIVSIRVSQGIHLSYTIPDLLGIKPGDSSMF